MIFSHTWLVVAVLARPTAITAENRVVDSCASEHSFLPEGEGNQLGLLQSNSVKTKLQPSGNETADGSQPATGASAALTETGYLIVSGQCCNYEMSEFIRRVAFDEGLQVCNEGALQGVTPYYSCTYGPRSLSDLKQELLRNSDSECPWVALEDATCPTVPAKCSVGDPANITYDCGCSRGDSFDIDFFGSTLTQNNLAGLGPDTGAPEIRYTNIGTFNGGVVDLVVTGSSSYASPNIASNGKNGKFGTINLLGGASVELTFTIVATGTNTPVQIGEIFISLFDLDQSFERKMLERIYASDYKAFVIDKHAENSIDIARAPDGRTVFKSKLHGTGCDNPKDPKALGPVTCVYRDGTKTVDQRERSLMLTYQKVSSFKITLEVTCIDPITGATDCTRGRNFLFAGKSSLEDRCAP